MTERMNIEEFKAAQRKVSKSRGNHVRGKMNSTESRFAETLMVRQHIGEIKSWEFETDAYKLNLGERCTLLIDFRVVLANGTVEMIDVKGGGPIQDDSIVKIKWAAQRYPEYQFVMMIERTKKDGGGFKRREFKR